MQKRFVIKKLTSTKNEIVLKMMAYLGFASFIGLILLTILEYYLTKNNLMNYLDAFR
jgi:hypothetical protein